MTLTCCPEAVQYVISALKREICFREQRLIARQVVSRWDLHIQWLR